jgi:hypothetical protein
MGGPVIAPSDAFRSAGYKIRVDNQPPSNCAQKTGISCLKHAHFGKTFALVE